MNDLVDISIETVNEGDFLRDANEALAEVLRHCRDNPDFRKPRKVKMEIAVTPARMPGTGEPYVETSAYAHPVLPPTSVSDGSAVLVDGRFKVGASETQMDVELHIHDLTARRAASADE